MARRPQIQDSIPLQPLGKQIAEEEEDEFDEDVEGEDLAELLPTKKKAKPKPKPTPEKLPPPPPAATPLPYARRGDTAAATTKPPSYSSSESRIPSWMRISMKDTILALSIHPTHIRVMIAFFAGLLAIGAINLLVFADILTRFQCDNNPPLYWFYIVDGPVPSIVGALILMTAVDHELLYDEDDATRRRHWVFFYISIFCGGLGICWSTFNLIYTYVRAECVPVGLLLLFSSLCAVLSAMLYKVRLFIVKHDD